jgi:hypothetical protein
VPVIPSIEVTLAWLDKYSLSEPVINAAPTTSEVKYGKWPRVKVAADVHAP